MKTKDKIELVKKLRKELKKDYGFCKEDFQFACYSCYSKLVDNFLEEWEEDLREDSNL